jgi:hypothetical protein
MPTRYIQKSTSLLSMSDGASIPPDVASIGVNPTTENVEFNATGTRRVLTDVQHLNIPLSSASVDGPVFIAPRGYKVVSVKVIASTAGASSSTVGVRKCTGTTAPASGTLVTTAALALDGTINTTVAGTLSATASDYTLAAGDKLAIDMTGTISSLVGVLTIGIRAI